MNEKKLLKSLVDDALLNSYKWKRESENVKEEIRNKEIALHKSEQEIQQWKGESEKLKEEIRNKVIVLSEAEKEIQKLRGEYDKIKIQANDRDAELEKYKNFSKKLLKSKRYRYGTAISEIVKDPLKLRIYIGKAFKRALNVLASRWRMIKPFKGEFAFNGVSVIIPTYKQNEYLDDCVQSVLDQTFPLNRIEIIISVNGKDKDCYLALKKKYKNNKHVKVVYTARVGLSAGRNYGLKFVSKDYLTFLDDDDYFTQGYLEELTSKLDKDISVVCGRLTDLKNNQFDNDTYINWELEKSGEIITKDIYSIGSLFSAAWAKLFNSKMVVEEFLSFREDFLANEDIIYWADNYCKIKGHVYTCKFNGKEALIRRVTENSLSRPSKEDEFKYFINDRIKIIKYLSEKMFEPNPNIFYKRFLINKIKSQTEVMLEYFQRINIVEQGKARKYINEADCFYLNKALFAKAQGIAFCHNFSPWADVSSYVAGKRLHMIDKLEGRNMKWDVISSNMSNIRKNDYKFKMFYTDFIVNKHEELGGKAFFNEKSQFEFGEDAFSKMKDIEAEVIYSRSFFAGSHVAAYKYKEKYPETKWYAEISDPIYMGTDNKKRETAKVYSGSEEFLNSFWRDCEYLVYEKADVIIFTNENQKTFMLDYCENKDLSEIALKKSIVLEHPKTDKKFVDLINSDYSFNKEKINIAYFGSFYPNRNSVELLKFLDNEDVVLHLFIQDTNAVEPAENLIINEFVSHFEFLNIAAKMDYLYINDIDFDGEINPYVPSKLFDYLATGTRIIAVLKEGSIMEKMDNKNIIKIKCVGSNLISKLSKSR